MLEGWGRKKREKDKGGGALDKDKSADDGMWEEEMGFSFFPSPQRNQKKKKQKESFLGIFPSRQREKG